MFEKKNQKGFTLIELLVVIAIIGLLSSVVLASLNSARTKGADSAIKAQLKSAQSQAEVLYDDVVPNSYAAVCANAIVQRQVTSARNSSASDVLLPNWLSTQVSSATQAVCHSLAANYAILVPLKSNTANAWCVDSNGSSQQVLATALISGDVACN